MLPKLHRLPSVEINNLTRYGKRVSSVLGLFLYKKSDAPVSRFAFVVSKKVDKRAVVRNRLKRIVSESVRYLLPAIKQPIDGVFLVRTGQMEKQKDVEMIITKIFIQEGLIKS
jgi:ribonuclease P protein component